MKCKVHYTGKTGSAEMIAEAIARAVEQPKEAIPPAYMPEGLPLMFLGCEDKGGKPDKDMEAFIATMDGKKVFTAALFGTSPKKDARFLQAMAEGLRKNGVTVLEEMFVCQGKGGLFSGGKAPAQADFDAAQAFAEKVLALMKR